MKPKERKIYKRILNRFKNIKPGKHLLDEEKYLNDGIKRIDLENSVLCLDGKGKLYTEKKTYFLDKNTCYCLFPELIELEKELNKIG